MQHNDNPSTSSSNGSMAEEHGTRIVRLEDEAIPWMVKPHAGVEARIETPTEEVCRGKLDSYSDYVWKRATHEPKMFIEQWWPRQEHLWPRIANIAKRHLATQESRACSDRSFSNAGLICARKWMVLTPAHIDALSLLGWHEMREKELLK